MKANKVLIIIGALFFLCWLDGCACHGIADPIIRKANRTILTNPYYANNSAVPVDNFYRYSPGCYIACYSKNANGSAYSVGQGIYVKGVVRVNGLYVGRICEPQGYFFKDISALSYFSNLCQKRIATCNNDNCWAGGDTGGWFGIR